MSSPLPVPSLFTRPGSAPRPRVVTAAAALLCADALFDAVSAQWLAAHDGGGSWAGADKVAWGVAALQVLIALLLLRRLNAQRYAVAALVVARWERSFDPVKGRALLAGKDRP